METISAQGAVVDKNLLVGGGVWGCHLKAPNTLTVEDVSLCKLGNQNNLLLFQVTH